MLNTFGRAQRKAIRQRQYCFSKIFSSFSLSKFCLLRFFFAVCRARYHANKTATPTSLLQLVSQSMVVRKGEIEIGIGKIIWFLFKIVRDQAPFRQLPSHFNHFVNNQNESVELLSLYSVDLLAPRTKNA